MKKKRRRSNSRRDRGSALLVSLMVIVGLSLLGLGFVALSETESTIAKNQAAALQTQAIAEAGARLVVEWFQDPAWALTYGCPVNNTTATPKLNNIKADRVSGAYAGKYKPDSTTKLFDKPYRSDPANRFYGAEGTPDIRISPATDQDTLDKINNVLLGTGSYDKATGELVEIDVYAPPIVGGTLTAGFWVGGQRYGVATIKTVAQQYKDPNLPKGSATGQKYHADNIVSSHSVRLVVGELPLPIPAGPIQGNANVAFGGNFRVHWGLETAQGTLTPSFLNGGTAMSALPWANAYERPHYEHGYEPGTSIASIIVTNGGSGYTAPSTVTVDATGGQVAPTVAATIQSGHVVSIDFSPNVAASRGSGYVALPPDWSPKVTIGPPQQAGGIQATAIASIGTEHWPITGADFDKANYFNELNGKTFDDPWFGARSLGDNLADGATAKDTSMQCWGYDYNSDETTTSTPSYAFQWQDSNVYPQKKLVTFPVIQYNYWKRIAQQGRGYKGIYYFNYAGASTFTKFNQGTGQPMYYWVNTMDGANLGPGVYFFDTQDGSNPQIAGGGTNTAVLTPPESWQSNNFGNKMLMVGFIYMNAETFGTTGQGNRATQVYANFPGEPYRDIGAPEWDRTTNNDWKRTGTGAIKRKGIGDGIFTYDDLNNNGRFDVVTTSAPSYNSYDPATTSGKGQWVVKTWKPPEQAKADYGAPCTVPPSNYNGSNGAATDCSEPHEPYLNLLYPDTAANNNGAPDPVIVGWEDPANQKYRKPKVTDPNTKQPVSCGQNSSLADCTSNAHDDDGAMVPIDVILDGVLYNEGNYDASGNSWYYGSLLIRGQIGSGGNNQVNGTADVWFDEKLLKGTWSPPNMPRVIVFNEQTDEVQQ